MAEHRKTFVLEKTVKRRKTPKKPLENVTKKYWPLKGASFKYNDLLSLHELWKKYFDSVSPKNVASFIDVKLLKMDFHGAILLVTKSSNSTLEGIHGIVVRETRNTFQLVSKSDKVVTIPKRKTVFQFIFSEKVFTVFGSNLIMLPWVRITKKFKAKLPELPP